MFHISYTYQQELINLLISAVSNKSTVFTVASAIPGMVNIAMKPNQIQNNNVCIGALLYKLLTTLIFT